MEKKVLITVDVAGIVVVGLMCRLWFDPPGEVWELDFEDRCLGWPTLRNTLRLSNPRQDPKCLGILSIPCSNT